MQMKEHMGHPILTVYITQKEKLIEVRQFHHRADGKIGYGLYPYAEDEKGHWRENLGVGLWIYREDFHLINPSSAEFIDYVSRWVIATLEQVDEIAIEGNL